MHPSSENPFQSPAVLEQIPPRPSEIDSTDDSMPALVALTWMFFLFAATIHAMASVYLRDISLGVAAIVSCGVGFAILYPSVLTWGLGLSYSFLMVLVMLALSAITYVGPRPPVIFEMPPLVLYLLIVFLLFQTSRRYYFDAPKHLEPKEPVES
ncbi:hypothetical protein [Blastopirellula marina]|uniref:Uncharacterized protein n=1 Tax=Blastopirellula marina TaxID=124 RepID=A0A2S8FWR8_9BACT|nr:hypothetical protein [Blastopirellula marina]PQO36626.1 hypothetical protein C5Y98_11565 [Blastopirellula marina]PTL44456.1 hypothetical protein C5Y97_11575 [Blastopirellula marina]